MKPEVNVDAFCAGLTFFPATSFPLCCAIVRPIGVMASEKNKDRQKKPKLKTTFSETYRKDFDFIESCTDDPYNAFCKVCRCTINIGFEGRLAIVNHEKTDKHKKKTKAYKCSVENP